MVKESRVSLRRYPLKQRYFCVVYNQEVKADLDKGYWNPKRKLGGTTHFSEIMKLSFNLRKMPYIVLCFSAF